MTNDELSPSAAEMTTASGNELDGADALYRECAPQAKRYAMSIVRSWSDAEELVQEAFCRLVQEQSESKAMLFTIIRNLALDLLRKNKRRRFDPVETSQIPNQRSSTDEARLQKLESEVQVSLGRMPTQWADALQLKVNGGLSYAEISNILEATHSQIRTWIYRARKYLEQDLVQQGLLSSGEAHV